MQYLYIHEILHLLFMRCNKNPEIFISYFNSSQSLIAFNYHFKKEKFTHISDSFKNILGFNNKRFLTNGNFTSHVIHPSDLKGFRDFFTDVRETANHNRNRFDSDLNMSIKCRTKHLKGFWKYLIFFSVNYWNENYECINKIGLILDEHIDQNYQILSNSDGKTVINDVSSRKTEKKTSQESLMNKISISVRETEILKFIGQGLVAKEIATLLQISTSTVISHRKNLIQKLKVKNTAELIKKASQLMLI